LSVPQLSSLCDVGDASDVEFEASLAV